MRNTLFLPRFRAALFALPILLALLGLSLFAQDGPDGDGKGDDRGRRPGQGRRHHQREPRDTYFTDVPAHPLDIVLGRPTDTSVTIRVLAYANTRCSIIYGPRPAPPTAKTAEKPLAAGEPVDFVLVGLQPDTSYSFRVLVTPQAQNQETWPKDCFFHTQRRPGSTFTFTVTADSHLDTRTVPSLYRQTLLNLLADAPDFNIDLGDTFMNDKKRDDRAELLRQYLAQRYYFGLIGHSVPLFLALGNHDGECIRDNDGTPEGLAAWSNRTRRKYFPNPSPDAFYNGNGTPDPCVGLLENYYSWTWGDAQFIVLDPYWHSEFQRGDDDNWKRSLGKAQFDWLKGVLEKSRAKYIFVFVHQLVAGIGRPGRGGAEAARLYEWGGQEPNGANRFAQKRPGWESPIHRLLLKHRATVVFHGHDHIYAQEKLDGLMYQAVPQPDFGGRFDQYKAEEGGYGKALTAGGSGYLRITVGPAQATVAYMQTGFPASGKPVPVQSYSVPPRN